MKQAVHSSNPVRFENNEWGFYDETWSVWYGGYSDQKSAAAACRAYAAAL